MAAGVTRLADLIVPEVFNASVLIETTSGSPLLTSGALVLDPGYSAALAGAGSIFHLTAFDDLDDDDSDVASDDPDVSSTPAKIASIRQTQVRLARNKSWSSMDLAGFLNNHGDPVAAISGAVGRYWKRQQQRIAIATMKGVFADNAAAPTGTEHVQNDMTYDVSGVAYSEGITSFTTEAYVNATATMSDQSDRLGLVFCHPVVYTRMRTNNLIDFIPDSINPQAAKVPTFQNSIVIQDKTMPNTGGVFETWFFAPGSLRMGLWLPPDASETERKPSAGNGSGQEILHSRVHMIIHPTGHKYVGTPPATGGGPSNAATANNLAHAGSWQRAFSEREQIPIARLITREY